MSDIVLVFLGDGPVLAACGLAFGLWLGNGRA
jgi:hypothetical protein